jgi:hypothetical protein
LVLTPLLSIPGILSLHPNLSLSLAVQIHDPSPML